MTNIRVTINNPSPQKVEVDAGGTRSIGITGNPTPQRISVGAAETKSIGIKESGGIQGVQGIQGMQGVQGTQGLQGVQGQSGTSQGIQGIQGPISSSTIQGLIDVDSLSTGTARDGETLTWNSSLGKWTAQTISIYEETSPVLAYDSTTGLLANITFASGRKKVLTYDANGLLLTSDYLRGPPRTNVRKTLIYNSNNQLLSITQINIP